MQGRRIAPATVGLDDDFDILIQLHQKSQAPFDRKLPELAAQHFRYIRLANAEQIAPSFCFMRRFFMIVSILNTMLPQNVGDVVGGKGVAALQIGQRGFNAG